MPLFKKSLAEFIGTFGLVFLGCGALMLPERLPGSISPTVVPPVFGLTVAALIYASGHISGAHFNPAVTIAFWSARHFPGREVIAYVLAQYLGSLAAMGALVLLLPAGQSFGATVPALPVWHALGWEIALTFFLMFVIIAVATDTRAVGTMAGAAIGAAVTIAAYVGGPLTGASMNPARSLGPALFEGRLEFTWIYTLGPLLGALLAAGLYEWMRCPSEDKNQAGGCC